MSKKTDKQNQSRLYYVSNQNMSDIKQSIEEYSMNFDKQSGIHKNSQSQIAQLISGSHPMSQSRGGLKSKTFLKPSQPIKQQVNFQHEPVQQIKQSRTRQQPVNLGDHVFNIIKERYYQINKSSTDDPDVLYDFFTSQRKQLSSMKPIKNEDIERQMPSMQRKLLVRKNFQKILTYYPHDVYYSLHLESEKQKIDRQQQYKLSLLNKQMQKQRQRQRNKKVSKQQIDQIVQNLHSGGAKKKKDGQKSPPKSGRKSRARSTSDSPNRKKMSKEQQQKYKRTQFGRRLSEHFQNTMRAKGHPANVQTVEKLYKFWDQQDRKSQYRIQWDEETAKIAIQQYMYEQMQDLMIYAQKKLGFKCEKAVSLFKIYQQKYEQLNRHGKICFPMNSFEQYVKVYNEVQERKQLQHLKEQQERKKTQQQRRKVSEAKKFGRPVSATPISILAKPKQSGPLIQQLAQKYPRDKLIKTLINEQNLKKARFSWQYGVHDLVQEVKVNQWVKIDPKNSKQDYQQTIVNQLMKTFSGNNNPDASVMGTSSMVGSYLGNMKQKDQLMNLFAQQNVYKDENWKQYGPLIQEAMLVKSYQNPWFRECIIKYLQKLSRENNKIQTDQVIFKKLLKYFDDLTQQQRCSELSKLERFIELSQSIAQKTQAQKKLQKDPSKQLAKQRRLFNDMLQKKAVDFVRERVQGKPIVMRNYLKQLFEQGMKQYPQYVKKTFNVVQGEKQCPKLLRYEFYRMAKEINKVTFQRVDIKRNPVWVPTKRMPEEFNYKTFNNFAQSYRKDKNAMVAKPERKSFGASLWGRNKKKDRLNLFMTYQDAKQCTFQPKCSKNAM